MSFDDQQFSRQAKLTLAAYVGEGKTDLSLLENLVRKVQFFDLDLLANDSSKKPFWINVYNGLTNLEIVRNQLKESVWEKEDFFTDRVLNVAGIRFSLDDIEHGILRRNGPRRSGKPDQFQAGDPRMKWMADQLDYRIHFALNCGSVSCPPIAFYDAPLIDEQLRAAEESFASSEFIVNNEKETVECSSIFVWYRSDFGENYLNAPALSRYDIVQRPYIWKIR